VSSGAAACPMALDPAFLSKEAPVLPCVHSILWVMGIKKGIVVLGVQRGKHVTKALPRVTEVLAKRACRRRYHDLQDMWTRDYSTMLQCGQHS
jgi:hypothetical protein